MDEAITKELANGRVNHKALMFNEVTITLMAYLMTIFGEAQKNEEILNDGRFELVKEKENVIDLFLNKMDFNCVFVVKRALELFGSYLDDSIKMEITEKLVILLKNERNE